MMMFAGYCVCGAGTKQDILYLHNVYVNNFAIYFHLYDRLKQSRARGERHPGRDGCCLVLVIIHPGNASQLKEVFEIHIFVSILGSFQRQNTKRG